MDRRNRATSRIAHAIALIAATAVLASALAACAPAQPTSGAAPGTSSSASPAASTPGVQHFDVDMSSGAYVPDRITAKAGVPVQITFGQGQGCVQRLVFPSFDIDADMTQGPKTFDLGALEPGEYTWACGMDMQHGVLIVE